METPLFLLFFLSCQVPSKCFIKCYNRHRKISDNVREERKGLDTGGKGMGMTQEAIEARRDYKRKYRSENREKINDQQREWRANNSSKVREYQKRYWEKRAEKRNIRATWEDYGISKERLEELTEIVKSGRCDTIVSSAACKADENAAAHIVLSVKRNLSYEHIEFHEKLGRCMLGRSNFYGARRLFFHYLDCALKEMCAGKSLEVKNG